MNVAERLFNQAKEGYLDGLREAAKLWCDFEVHFDLGAFGKTVDDPAGGGDQARFIQQRGMQKLREGANFLETLIDPLGCFRYGFFVGLEISGFNQSIELQLCGGKLLAGGIVQLPGDGTSVLIPLGT